MIPQSFAALVQAPLSCGRVIAQQKNLYTVLTQQGETRAQILGGFCYGMSSATDYPVVGDYVAVCDRGGVVVIEKVLTRANLFSRRSVDGSHDLQPIAANIDTLFVTVAVNRDFNVRRLERYMIAAAAFGVPVAIVLTKIDLVDDPEWFVDEVHNAAVDTPVVALCAFDQRGFECLKPFRGTGKTIGFVGSSGVGKSTLINALLECNLLDVGPIRRDDRGRHTTTTRCLVYLDDGTAVIDTPGMREFALADAGDGVSSIFQDVASLAEQCRFSDCRHTTEPGCAVLEGVDESRLLNYRKLEREAAFQSRKENPRAAEAERARWKAITKANRQRNRYAD